MRIVIEMFISILIVSLTFIDVSYSQITKWPSTHGKCPEKNLRSLLRKVIATTSPDDPRISIIDRRLKYNDIIELMSNYPDNRDNRSLPTRRFFFWPWRPPKLPSWRPWWWLPWWGSTTERPPRGWSAGIGGGIFAGIGSNGPVIAGGAGAGIIHVVTPYVTPSNVEPPMPVQPINEQLPLITLRPTTSTYIPVDAPSAVGYEYPVDHVVGSNNNRVIDRYDQTIVNPYHNRPTTSQFDSRNWQTTDGYNGEWHQPTVISILPEQPFVGVPEVENWYDVPTVGSDDLQDTYIPSNQVEPSVVQWQPEVPNVSNYSPSRDIDPYNYDNDFYNVDDGYENIDNNEHTFFLDPQDSGHQFFMDQESTR